MRVDCCRFVGNDCALELDHLVDGQATGNTLDGTMFGRCHARAHAHAHAHAHSNANAHARAHTHTHIHAHALPPLVHNKHARTYHLPQHNTFHIPPITHRLPTTTHRPPPTARAHHQPLNAHSHPLSFLRISTTTPD